MVCVQALIFMAGNLDRGFHLNSQNGTINGIDSLIALELV